ncbi:MAG: hypothetical protein RIT45_3683, partial [Pseudomonadota bacterium]
AGRFDETAPTHRKRANPTAGAASDVPSGIGAGRFLRG